jgi:adenylate cyclase
MPRSGSKRRTASASLPSTPAIIWLLREGASAASPAALLTELCNRVSGGGLPLANVSLAMASVDPVVARTRLLWQRDSGRVIEEVLLHGMPAEATTARSDAIPMLLPGTDYEIVWRTDRPGGFTDAERDRLETICLMMSAPMQVVVGRGNNRNLLQAYLGRRSAEKVLSGAVRRGIGETIEAVVWVSDLRDFTRLSEALSSDQVITALNDCCARLVGAIQPFGGEVLKFVGDGILAIFPLADHGDRAACDAAIAAVRAARQGMALLDAERVRSGLPPLPFGVGLHLGTVVYGNIGAPNRLDFTAIGPVVNAASRIEGLCRSLGYPVLMSQEVASLSSHSLTAIGRHSLRGTAQPVALFTLPELESEGGRTVASD